LRRVPLGPGDLHLWYRVTDSLDDAAVTEAIALLSGDERARYANFVFPRDRRDFAAAHALVRRRLSDYEALPPEAWTFERTAHGKPALPVAQAGEPPLAFNLSHTRGLVACAVGRLADVGVDVEAVDRMADRQEVADRFFTREEIALLESVRGDQAAVRFTELWTLKEAYLKAVGVGLSRPLNEFGFGFPDAGHIRFAGPLGRRHDAWSFVLFAPTSRTRMAVAIRSEWMGRFHVNARDDAGEQSLAALAMSTPLT
jgi:4'-phosphopantetheinyl transferase